MQIQSKAAPAAMPQRLNPQTLLATLRQLSAGLPSWLHGHGWEAKLVPETARQTQMYERGTASFVSLQPMPQPDLCGEDRAFWVAGWRHAFDEDFARW